MYKAFPLEICMCVFGTDFTDFEFWSKKKKGVCDFRHVRLGTDFTDFAFLSQKKKKDVFRIGIDFTDFE